MGTNVFANNMAISAKAGDGKLIAAFPDTCNSPPSPPTGPVPIPYPNSAFSRDLQKGTKRVQVGGKPVAVEDSYFKTSPLGNEAATKSWPRPMMLPQLRRVCPWTNMQAAASPGVKPSGLRSVSTRRCCE